MESAISSVHSLITFFNGKPTSCYRTGGIKIALRGCTLSIIRCTSATFLVLGASGLAMPKLMGTHAFLLLPSAASLITIVALGVLIGSKFLIQKITKNEFYLLRNGVSKGHPLQTIKNEPQEFVDLLDELCENGSRKGKLSLQRAEEIIRSLKEANKLYLLNALFTYQPYSHTPRTVTTHFVTSL